MRSTDFILPAGVHGTRPAAGAGVGYGVLFSCTTHKKIYRHEAAGWVDWLDLSTITTTFAGLTDVDYTTPPTNGQVPVFDTTSGKWKFGTASGGGSAWSALVNNPLTAMTGFTGLSGTWTAASGQIAQTGTGASYSRAKYDTPTVRALGAVQCEVRYDSAGSGATRGVGLVVGFDGTDNAIANLNMYLITADTGATWKVRVEANGVGNLGDFTVAYTAGNYATLAAVHTTEGIEIYYNGTYIALVRDTAASPPRVALSSYIGFVTFGAAGTFRNLKTWGISHPAIGGSGVAGSVIKDRRWVPASTDTVVDEFNDDALDPAWVRVDPAGAAAANCTWTEKADVVVARRTAVGNNTGAAKNYLTRPLSGMGGPLATGDAIYTAYRLMAPVLTNYSMAGIMLSDAASGASKCLIGRQYHATAPSSPLFDLLTQTNFDGTGEAQINTLNATNFTANMLTYLRLVYLGGTTWRLDRSWEGVEWEKGSTYSYASFTPTHFSIWDADNGTATKHVSIFETVRRQSGVS